MKRTGNSVIKMVSEKDEKPVREAGDLCHQGTKFIYRVQHKEGVALAVPTNAVLLDEDGATIWVRTAHNTYQSRMVETGIRSNGFTEIKKGLVKGEWVVVSGAFLLNSEFIFQKGSSPMAGHDMSKM